MHFTCSFVAIFLFSFEASSTSSHFYLFGVRGITPFQRKSYRRGWDKYGLTISIKNGLRFRRPLCFSISLPAVVHGLVVNPVGAAGFVVVVAGAGVGWFGLAWLADASTIVRALL